MPRMDFCGHAWERRLFVMENGTYRESVRPGGAPLATKLARCAIDVTTNTPCEQVYFAQAGLEILAPPVVLIGRKRTALLPCPAEKPPSYCNYIISLICLVVDAPVFTQFLKNSIYCFILEKNVEFL